MVLRHASACHLPPPAPSMSTEPDLNAPAASHAHATPENASTEPDAAAPDPTQALADLEARLTAMSDNYLRAKAESENVRRRAEEESSKARKFAIEGFAESLLPVRDSLEAALALPAASNEQLLEGVRATLRQLTQALERNKVMPIEPPAGTRFDPHQHQAISMVPADQDANTVVTVLQKGYLIADRVLRPALVTVAAPK
jgi:molecular chaperone GrpE